MIKYLFIVVNSFILFLFSWLDDGKAVTVNLSANIPATMVAGQPTNIELKITKINLNGFARLQLILPEGVVVKESEDKGASYSFNGTIAKWVWATLPDDEEMTVKVTLLASESAIGKGIIKADFSYVDNNSKQLAEIAPVEVDIVKGESAAANDMDTTAKQGAPVINSNSEPPGVITATRLVTKGANGHEYTIEVKINKGLTKGFARYSDDMPPGIIAKSAKTDGSSFSVADGKVRFVWVSAPDKEMLDISYVISSVEANTIVLNGEYSYLEQNQSKKLSLPERTLIFEIADLVKNKEEKDPPVKAEPAETVLPVETPTLAETPKQEPEPKPAITPVKKEGKATFAVQIGAFTNSKVNQNTLIRLFNITEKIRSEMTEGFSKFMIGSHDQYNGARDHREKTKTVNGVKSAFVVAYNEGKRITVQEALMVLNQKWIK